MKSSLDRIFYKIVYHHIIYICDFFVNLDDFFVVVCTDFHESLVSTRYVLYEKREGEKEKGKNEKKKQVAAQIGIFFTSKARTTAWICICFRVKIVLHQIFINRIKSQPVTSFRP